MKQLPQMFLSLGLLLLGVGPAEGSTRMRHQPWVHEGQPFEVVLTADFEFEVIEQSHTGTLYKIVSRRQSFGMAMTVRFAGPTSRAAHRIEWWDRPASGPDVLLEALEVFPDFPLALDAPERPTDQESLVISLSGTAACPALDGPARREGSLIVLRYRDACGVILPEPPQPFTLTAPPLPPLPVGRYRIEARDVTGLPVADRELRVVPSAPRLQGGRFAVELTWRVGQTSGGGRQAELPGRDSAVFHFFDAANWEFLVKVLDGCAINGHFWVFGAASTAVGYTLEVRDLERPELAARTYDNPEHQPAAAITDTLAFPCAEANS